MELKEIILIFGLIILLFIIFTSAFNASRVDIEDITSGECNFPRFTCKVGEATGLPSGWLRYNTFLKYVLLPFMGICFIVYGFLDAIKIFPQNRINAILSVIISLSTIFVQVFTVIVATMFATLGMFSTFAFFLLFVIGLFYLIKFAIIRK